MTKTPIDILREIRDKFAPLDGYTTCEVAEWLEDIKEIVHEHDYKPKRIVVWYEDAKYPEEYGTYMYQLDGERGPLGSVEDFYKGISEEVGGDFDYDSENEDTVRMMYVIAEKYGINLSGDVIETDDYQSIWEEDND